MYHNSELPAIWDPKIGRGGTPKTADHFYVACKAYGPDQRKVDSYFLHKNGFWSPCVSTGEDDFAGYFPSEVAAQIALDKAMFERAIVVIEADHARTEKHLFQSR